MSDSVQAQLEAVLRGIEERLSHAPKCDERYDSECECDWAARVRAEQARTVERMLAAAIERSSFVGRPDDAPWAAALRAGEEPQ